MKIEINPEKTALLVLDMQNDFVTEECAAAKWGYTTWKMVKKNNVIENISRVVEVARDVAIPVFHVRTVHRKGLRDFVETVSDMSLKDPEKIL